jgi:sortase A
VTHHCNAIEAAAWILGVAMLSTYGGVRYRQALAREAGVAAFELSRREHGDAASTQTASASGAPAVRNRPDMSTWSTQRIDAYRKSSNASAIPEAVLRIPRLELAVPVFAGTSETNLDRGAGFIEGTARTGGAGNVGIAAHRDGFFRVLKDVQVGDVVLLEQPAATHIYKVAATRIVEPADIDVLGDTALPTVTLVTCYPFYFVGSAPKRFIVHAQLVMPAPSRDRKTVL